MMALALSSRTDLTYSQCSIPPLDFGTQSAFLKLAHGNGAVDVVGKAVKHAVWGKFLQDHAVSQTVLKSLLGLRYITDSVEEFARVALCHRQC